MLDISKIKELQKLCQSLEIISVYDTGCYSYQEMLYLLKNKINELVLKYNCDKDSLLKVVDDLFNKLENLQQDVKLNVAEIILKMLEDGTLTSIINEEIFGYIITRLKELTDLVNTFDGRITTLETNIEKYRTELIEKINSLETKLTEKINTNHREINDKVDGIRDDLQKQIDDIEVGGGGTPTDITPALNNINFGEGLKFKTMAHPTLGVTIWYATIPKSSGTLKQGFSTYYRNNPLSHEADKTDAKREVLDDISQYYNSTVCISGSAFHSDGTGFIGTIIDDGVIKHSDGRGWFTCGIDNNNTLQFFMPDTPAETVKASCNTAFDIMQPLVKNGALMDSSWYNKWEGFYDKKAPRTVLGEDKKGNWFFMVTHGRTKNQGEGVTYATLADVLINEFKLKNACCTDGGGSAEIILNNAKLNWNIDNFGTERRKLGNGIVFFKHPAPENKGQEAQDTSSKITSYVQNLVNNTASKQGVFYEMLKGAYVPYDDLNQIKRSGLFWAHAWTQNSPGSISYGILHFQVDENNAMQYAFPFADNGYKIMMRKTQSESNYTWGSWVYPQGNS